jgi:hypothetical protein
MATILFDKMRAARRLEGEGNFTRQQAETLSEVMHDSLSEGVATKADLDGAETALKADMGLLKADMGLLRADMGALRSELKADMSSLRADLKSEVAVLEAKIAESKLQIIVWVTGLLIASGVVQHFLH